MVFVIGVAGPSCGGKTTVCNKIQEKILSTAGIDKYTIASISQDSYYGGGDSNTNYDVPNAIDFDLLIDHLKTLISGKAVNVPVYDFSKHKRSEKILTIQPAEIILIEGILIFSQEKLRDLCDLKVFVEADSVVCYTRRLKRDIKERGRSIEEVEQRYLDHVVPSCQNYINPSRFYANISLINNTHGEFVGLDVLLAFIEMKLLKLLKLS